MKIDSRSGVRSSSSSASWASRSPRSSAARAELLHVGARRRGAFPRRPLRRRDGGRAEHAGEQRAPALGHRGAEDAATSRGSRRTRSAPTRSRSPVRDATPSLFPAARSSRETSIGSPARSSGSPTGARPGSSSSSPPSIPARATRASPRFSSSAASRASPSARRKTSSASAPRARPSSSCRALRVPRANVLGEVGKGYKIAIETLNEGRIGIGAQMIGVASGALEQRWATPRSGRRSASRSPSSRACSSSSRRRRPSSRPRGSWCTTRRRLEDAGKPFLVEAAMAKLFSSQVAERVTSLAIELYGGYGYTKDFPVEKF